jgi:hypothetical protein
MSDKASSYYLLVERYDLVRTHGLPRSPGGIDANDMALPFGDQIDVTADIACKPGGNNRAGGGDQCNIEMQSSPSGSQAGQVSLIVIDPFATITHMNP